MKHSILFCLLYFLPMFLAGVVAEIELDEITQVDLPVETTSTLLFDQATSVTFQASEDTYHTKDDTSTSKEQSDTISTVQVDKSVDNFNEEIDVSKSITSAELEPSYAETLVSSLSEQTVTQSDVTATVVTATSSVDGLVGQNSVVEPQQLIHKVEDTVVNEIKEPASEETVQAEESTNSTLTEEPDTNKIPEPTLEPVVMTTEPSHQLPGPGTGGAAIIPETEVEKTEEEGLTFNEWTQKVLAEVEKGKQAQKDTVNVPLPPVGKQRKRKNYAAHDCGAKILTSNTEATNAKSVLNSNKDEYMINPCKVKKWFVIELCEPIQAHSVEIASLELFSSQPKKFRVFLSDRYPTKDWKFAGEFETKDERIVQGYEITETQEYYAKYVRVELVDHFGDEHFCPLTLFKVLGVAVDDDEDDHHGDDDGDEDDEDNGDNDKDEGSKNLFTSAKDTVMNIVKKVLNVDMEVMNINASLPNATSDDMNDTITNGSSTSENTMPCLPEASIPDGERKIPICEDKSKSTVGQPQPPEPGKTDSVIVVKIEDDEQIETTDSDSLIKNIPLSEHLKDCYKHLNGVFKTVTPHSCFHSKLCVFTFMVYRLCHPALPNVKELIGEAEMKSDNVVVKGADLADVIADEDKAKLGAGKGVIQDSHLVSTKSEHAVSVSDGNNVQKTSEVENKREDTTDTVTSIKQSKDVMVTKTDEEKITQQSTKPSSVTSSYVEATKTVTVPSQTGSKVIESDTKLVSDSVKIDPSPTFVDPSGTFLQKTETHATPSLSDEWEPHTKDVVKDESVVIGQKSHVQSETSKGTPGTVSMTPNAPEAPSVSITLEPAVAMETTDTDIVDEDVAALDMDTENVEQKSNTTIIDEKVVVSNGGGGKKDENLNLVRLPALSGSKRESAIMRLSNRIKVLEQNVSLSSRFLEELSRRYKKQSEDMMKMLNKTMAQLHNVTVEADVKSKIHEDEMTSLESRLENLTKIVTKLTHSFDHLNQQVTDRQMIWTTIEMIIIIVIMTFLYFRRKHVTVPSDLRALIEAMPAKPDTPLRHRRNSLSGPPTPLKEKALSTLHKGGGLQRFNSEIALGSARQEFLNTQSSDVANRQGNDGVKKKKKKKHKGSDLKLFSNASVPFYPETGSTALRANSSQQPVLSDAQSTNVSTQYGTKNSANLFPCSKSKSCFGSLLSGWNGSHGNKVRSASFDISNDRNSLDDFLVDGQIKGHSDANDELDSAKNSLGAKNGMKGPTQKPPLPAGSKQSPKLKMKSLKTVGKGTHIDNSNKNVIKLEEKWIVKGHKRQKSLPKDYASVETIGPSYKKTKYPDSLGREKNEKKSGPTKLSKREEKSVSVSYLPEPDDIQSAPKCASQMTDSRGVVNDELLDSEQMDQCYSLERSQSDIYLMASYGRSAGVDGYVNSMNGHHNGVTYDDSIGSSDVFSQNGADFIENDIYVDADQLPVNIVDAPSNRKWKNVFNFFH